MRDSDCSTVIAIFIIVVVTILMVAGTRYLKGDTRSEKTAVQLSIELRKIEIEIQSEKLRILKAKCD